MKSMSTPSISVMNCVEPRFHLAPVVIRGPITREFLDRRDLHALRFVRDSFSLRLAGALMRLRNSVSLASGTSRGMVDSGLFTALRLCNSAHG